MYFKHWEGFTRKIDLFRFQITENFNNIADKSYRTGKRTSIIKYNTNFVNLQKTVEAVFMNKIKLHIKYTQWFQNILHNNFQLLKQFETVKVVAVVTCSRGGWKGDEGQQDQQGCRVREHGTDTDWLSEGTTLAVWLWPCSRRGPVDTRPLFPLD